MPGTYFVQNPKAPREPIFSSTALAMAASSMFSSAARERKTAVEESRASAMVAVSDRVSSRNRAGLLKAVVNLSLVAGRSNARFVFIDKIPCLTNLGYCGKVRGVRNTPPVIARTRLVEGELLEEAASGEYLLRHRITLRLTRGLLAQVPKSLNHQFLVFPSD